MVMTAGTGHASVTVFNVMDDMASTAAQPTAMEQLKTMSWRYAFMIAIFWHEELTR